MAEDNQFDNSDLIPESPTDENYNESTSNSKISIQSLPYNYSNSESDINSDEYSEDDKLNSSNEAQVRNRANDLAKSQIKKIENEMKKMHLKHCQLLKDMDNNYAAIEQETHQRYIEFINKWKDQLKQKIEQYRKIIESLNMEVSELKDLNSNSQEIVNKAISEKNTILDRYNREITEKDEQKEKELAAMQSAYDKQIKVIQREKADLQQRLEEALQENSKLKDTAEQESAKAKGRLHRYKVTEKELKHRIRQVEHDYAFDISSCTMQMILKQLEENEQIKENVFTMKAEIEKLRKKKTAVKKQITQWVQDFEKANNRKCENTDKEQIKHLYTKYVEKNKKHEGLLKKFELTKYECSLKKISIEERNPTPFKLRSRSPSSNLNVSVDSVVAAPLRERKTPRDDSGSKEKNDLLENVRKDLKSKVVLSNRSVVQTPNTVANNIICSASSMELQQIKLERDSLKTEVSKLTQLLKESKKEAFGPVIEETQQLVEKFKSQVNELDKKLKVAESLVEKYKYEYEALINQITETQDNDNAELSTLKSQLAYCNSELIILRERLMGSSSHFDVDLMFQQKKLSDENSKLHSQVAELKAQVQGIEQDCQAKIKESETKSNSAVRQIHEDLSKARKEIIRLQEADKELRTLKDRYKEEKKALLDSNADLENKATGLIQEIQELRIYFGNKEQELKDSIRQRKLLHNQLEDLRGKIRVFCRVRPMSTDEIQKGCSNIVTISDDFSVNVEAKPGVIKSYMYDTVFGPSATQEEVFEDTKRLIQSAVDGFNVCIFAYGQTGSGKTHTIQGYPGLPGIAPRGIDELFSILNSLPQSHKYKVSCYMVELHLHHLVDLLRPKSREPPPPLSIKSDAKGMVYIPEVYLVYPDSAAEMKAIYEDGVRNRHTSKTKMNDVSSRSHLIFCVLIEVANNEFEKKTVGKLCFVDLAGSERLGRSEATAENLKETAAINASLTALGDVISALLNKVSYIPYRNNKLTKLMMDSIGGTAKTLMFVNISPASVNCVETMTSLGYGSRVKLITNEPVKNVEGKELSGLKSELMAVTTIRDQYKNMLIQAKLLKQDEVVDSDEDVN